MNAYQTLSEKLTNLCERDQATARSLLSAARTWGWSPKQKALAETLAERAEKGPAPSVQARQEFSGSPEAQEQARRFGTLLGRLGQGEPSDFARGLFTDIAGRLNRPLSEKQWALLEKLTQESGERKAKAEAIRTRPAEQALGGTFAPMLVMFQLAGQHLKTPRVRLVTEAGRRLILSVAGATSKYAGQIFVKQARGEGYYGRVDKAAQFWGGRDLTPDLRDDVVGALEAFAKDPAQAARAYGQRTGRCCFCEQELTDDRSIKVGYGPVCAGKHGLPWGQPEHEHEHQAAA